MTHFLEHTSCYVCGSSDARALYSDGGWYCFSCKASGKGNILNKLKEHTTKEYIPLPEDITTHYNKYITWFTKYGISIEDLITHGVYYSPSWDRIYFTWKDTDVWQSRKNPEKKIYTSGSHENVLLLYYNGSSTDRCILTEDPLSAIKIASQRRYNGVVSDAMPLLGTALPSTKMKGLKRLYSRVDVFLDHDKGKEAMKISKRLQLLGMESRVYVNKLDPKEITYDELRSILL